MMVESTMEQPLVSNIDTNESSSFLSGETIGFDEESLIKMVSPREFVNGNHE